MVMEVENSGADDDDDVIDASLATRWTQYSSNYMQNVLLGVGDDDGFDDQVIKVNGDCDAGHDVNNVQATLLTQY